MKRLFTILLVAALAMSASALFAQTLVYGTTDKVTDMDPASAYDFHTWEIFQNVSCGLLQYTPGTTDLVPGLATGYTTNPAGDQYTFTLRKGVKFSDGTPFTAQVVKWSIDRVAKLNGDPAALVTQYVKSVDVVNDYTVRFNLTGPLSYLPQLVATPTYFPMDPKVYPEDKIVKDVSELNGGEIAALGPYQLTSFKRDEQAVFQANPNYFGKEPAVKKIIIRYFADATTMRLALERGEIDLAFKSLNPSDIDDLLKNPKFVGTKIPGPQIRYLCFETSESVFKDKRLRQAVAALINRPEINQKVYLGHNAPLYSMIPVGMSYHTDAFKTVLGDANVALAEKDLKAAGYSADNPFTFDLWYTPSHYGDTEVNMAEVLQAELQKTPLMKVTIKSAEWATYKQQFNNKQMPVFFLGWYPDYIDPDDYTSPFAQTEGSKGNGIFFSSKAWDDLFIQEQQTTKDATRNSVFAKLQQMWTDEVPTAPIFQGNLYVFTTKNVTGVKIGPTLIFNYNTLSFVTK
ncbi:MAG TPA: ABC transporter substrate-binding protein [Spirochaetia bacterium]|nr:ABC transporter substrate-binding protein [Spirochaetia bacterium]